MYEAPTVRPPFTLLAVGLVMTVVDVRVNGLDLIPDCIGFLLATLALFKLQHLDGSFVWAGVITAVMTPVSIVSLNQPSGSHWKTGTATGDLAWAVATIAVDWLVCSGVASAARRHGNTALAATATNRRLLVALTGVAVAVVPLFRHTSPGTMVALLVALAVAAIVVFCLVIGLLRQAGRAFTLPAPTGVTQG